MSLADSMHTVYSTCILYKHTFTTQHTRMQQSPPRTKPLISLAANVHIACSSALDSSCVPTMMSTARGMGWPRSMGSCSV
jgi:hypothetical protein